MYMKKLHGNECSCVLSKNYNKSSRTSLVYGSIRGESLKFKQNESKRVEKRKGKVDLTKTKGV